MMIVTLACARARVCVVRVMFVFGVSQRFRKNVPRNMRPLVEEEDDKQGTPESQRYRLPTVPYRVVSSAVTYAGWMRIVFHAVCG